MFKLLLILTFFGSFILDFQVKAGVPEESLYPQPTMDVVDHHDPDVPYWTSSGVDTSSQSPDYGLNSYYGETEGVNSYPLINMDPNPQIHYYSDTPQVPHFPEYHQYHVYRRPRPKPKSFLRILQSTLSSKAGRNLKSLQSALKALGVTAAPTNPAPSTTPTIDTQLASEPATPTTNTTTKSPPANPAVELLVQLAPTLSKLVDSVGNAVAGEGSLLALKRDSILAKLKYKKALFIGLPESLIMAKLNLPNTLVKGKKALLGVVSSLAAPPPMSMISPDPTLPGPFIPMPGNGMDPMVMADPTPVMIENPSNTSSTTPPPTPEPTKSEKGQIDLYGHRTADQVSIAYPDLEPMSSQIRFHSPSKAFFSLQRPRHHHVPPSPKYYSHNHFHHRNPFKQRRRRVMFTFD